GWIQLYSENNQEAYDNLLMANRIAENKKVMLPVMVCQDGFITSHGVENIELEEDKIVKKFVGEYKPEAYLLNKDNPIAVGSLDHIPHYFEHKRQQAQAMADAKEVILQVSKDFEKLTGRKYGFYEEYKTDDAQAAIVALNSTAGTVKFVVDKMRKEGKKVGLIKLRVFRPFPVDELVKTMTKFKAVAVMDKADSFNAAGGPVFTDITSAMYAKSVGGTSVINYIYGLGGRDIKTEDIEVIYNRLLESAKSGKAGSVYNYIGVRE
ncbi:MAG: pyruvate ferredoxin oxidoreductase, partial [Eubacteriales bacterium]|nr:pyruvate ferredoxin oxidoreductase [Eubacteriales bacterium]